MSLQSNIVISHGKREEDSAAIVREKKIVLHEEVMECVTWKWGIKSKKYLCSEHESKTVTKSKTFKYNGVPRTRVLNCLTPFGQA